VPGAIFAGRYQIINMLGRGGMGEVYRAFDLQLQQSVAVKFVTSARRDAGTLERFRNEVRTAREITHPNVCRVYDIGESETTVYMTMEYIDGEDLASLLIRIGRFPEDKGIEIARQLCAGLAAAHDKGIVHRDLKPGNIMIDGRGQVHITDFGLAAVADLILGKEASSGTPMYMAPEQLSGEHASVRSDIYALGLVLYEVFTGRRPFETSSPAELCDLRKHAPAPRPSTVIHLDTAIDKAIVRCLDSDPQQRPPTARSLITAFPTRDPLGAALAAGETPSPDVIADAGGRGIIAFPIGIALLAFIVCALIALPIIAYRVGWLSRTNLDQSPDVLAHHARKLAAEFGYSTPPRDAVYSLSARRPNVDHFPQFWYREAPCILQGNAIESGFVPPGYIDQDNPANPCPDAITMELDIDGRLVSLKRLAPTDPPDPNASEPQWSKVLSAAGFDASALTQVPATVAPPVPFDHIRGWKATRRGGQDVRLEAASWCGKPVYFAYIEDSSQNGTRSPSSRQTDSIGLGVILLVLSAATLLARKNIKSGRIDRRGASRISAFVFILCMCVFAFSATHRITLFELAIVVYALGWSFVTAGLVWVIYVALDPFIRRRWPHSIISLNRLILGRVRDPLVGRDVMIGIAASCVFALIQLVQIHQSWANATPGPAALNGAWSLLGALAFYAQSAIWTALVLFCLVFVLRVVLRRAWLVAAILIALSLVEAILSGRNVLTSALLGTVSLGIRLVVLLRFGVLPFVVASFFAPVLLDMPYTPDFSKWYAAPPIIILAITLASAIWAFSTALPKRTVISDNLLYT